jgi:hypothetical protein
MPGLMRGMVRTAAVVGTASATRNAVNHRQAQKYAAQEAPPPQQEYAPPPPPPAAPVAQEDPITQLERLGALKAQGLLTEEEFNAQKAKILGL